MSVAGTKTTFASLLLLTSGCAITQDDLDEWSGAGGAGGALDCDDADQTVLPDFRGSGCLIVIEANTFDMGCTPGQQNCTADQEPVRPTTLTRNYYMGRTEVTQRFFEAFMGYNPSSFTNCGSTCPVEGISWHEAAAFANAISAAADLPTCYDCSGSGTSVTCYSPTSVYDCEGYRLPTEAEWEGAARCGDDLLYAGSNKIGAVAWSKQHSDSTTHRVGGLAPNACGLYDMSGNVFEWTSERYVETAYSAGAAIDPSDTESEGYRVLRGGSWKEYPFAAQVAFRRPGSDGFKNYDIGLRLVRTAP